jgi:hypothetical protein
MRFRNCGSPDAVSVGHVLSVPKSKHTTYDMYRTLPSTINGLASLLLFLTSPAAGRAVHGIAPPAPEDTITQAYALQFLPCHHAEA